MKAFFAIALLRLATGQQKVELVDVKSAVVVQPDGGMVEVGDGAWLSTAGLIADAKLHADLEEQNKSLVQHAPDTPYAWVVASLAVGITIGFGAAWALKQ